MFPMYPIAVALTAVIRLSSASLPGTEIIARNPTPNILQIQADLGPKLSEAASLYFPGSPEFGNQTERWSAATESDVLIVVVARCEKDVETAVNFANRVNLPFLAVNQGHGLPITLSTIKQGVLIKMDQLNSIQIAADGKTATMGGGVYVDQVLASLAERNKVAATCAGGCIGMLGCGLGGGFGKYMGYAGLVSDNILAMNVVTADGCSIKVSKSSNPDLYWAMRGAGHNFGIVTEFKHEIFDYPSGQDTYYVSYMFTEGKLESFFELYNKLLGNGTLPRDANVYAIYHLDLDINPKPVIVFKFYYFGNEASALRYVQPFLVLGPVSITNGTALYKDVAHVVDGTGVNDLLCAPGLSKATFPVGLKRFNIESNRKVYNLFAQLVAKEPAFAGSIIQFEGYPLQGMKAVNPASSAYAHRDDNILVSFTLLYPPTPANDATASKYGNQARQLWTEGERPRKLTVYTNYAFGDETSQQIYGYEPWRLRRLRELKEKWDPKGRFNFYNPIV